MVRPKLQQFKFKYVDRTTKFTSDTLKKLEEAASFRLDVKSSSAYAKISRDTYYRWMKDIPGLSDRLDDLREHPIIRAKKSIVEKLDDVNVAFRYLEKESPEDYGEKVKIEHSGEVIGGTTNIEDAEVIAKFHSDLKENMRKRSLKEAEEKGELIKKDGNNTE